MADEDKNQGQEQTQENELDQKTVDKINSIVTNQLKRLEKKLTQSQKAQPDKDPETQEEEKSASSDNLDEGKQTGEPSATGFHQKSHMGSEKQVEKLQKKLNEFEKKFKEQEQKAKTLSLNNKLNNQLKDKVSADWLDVAVEKISNQVQFDGDNPQMMLDETPYDLDEGVNAWLEKPENKRFLPSPGAKRRVDGVSNKNENPQDLISQFKQQNGQQEKIDTEEKLRLYGEYLNKEGI